MEVLRHRPQPDADDYDKRRPLIVAEGTPHPLVWAGEHLTANQRREFPWLDRLRLNSPTYDGEWQWLAPDEAAAALTELRRLRAACLGAAGVVGLDGPAVWERWRAGHESAEFAEWLDSVEGLLERAAQDWLVVLVSL